VRMVINMVKGKAKAAGSFLGGIANNPGIIIISAIGIALLFFAGDIRRAFAGIGEGFGKIEFPDITLPTIEFPEITFPTFEFPEFDFPEFPPFPDFNLCSLFGIGCPGDGDGDDIPGDLPPDVEDTGLLTPDQRAACECGTSIIQDIEGDVSETCIPCPQEEAPEELPPDFIGPPGPGQMECFEIPQIGGGILNTCTGIITPPEPITPPADEPFTPPVELPPDFEGGGPSFEGGTIFERDPCFMTLNEIINAGLASSASAAADLRARACSANVTDEPSDFPEDFDFGTVTGSGFGPGDDQTDGIVTGGATLESEEKKAACLTCELFGLNCPICQGTL